MLICLNHELQENKAYCKKTRFYPNNHLYCTVFQMEVFSVKLCLFEPVGLATDAETALTWEQRVNFEFELKLR